MYASERLRQVVVTQRPTRLLSVTTVYNNALRIAVAAVSLVGCVSIKPPELPPTPSHTYVRAPVDSVWQRDIGFFADARIPIQTIEKASGLIASTRFRLSTSQTRDWADCG